MTSKKITGVLGEDKACEYLIQNGYTVTCRNARRGHLEVDIICENEEFLVFAEVKTRKNNPSFGRPAAAVNYKKRQNIIAFAEAYISEHGTGGKCIRLDVVEVYTDGKTVYQIEHLKNAITK